MKRKAFAGLIGAVFILLVSLLSVWILKNKDKDYIDKLIDKYDPVGASVAVIKDGEISEIRNYGYADLENNIKVNDNTKFKIASISKTVTSYAVMQLVDEGKLDLDEPVNTYLKKWKVPESSFDENKVTLRTLLSHTSGITGSDENGYEYPLPTIDEALRNRDIKLKREPGKEFEYSEFAGFGICQLVVEDVTGEKFEDYMIHNVFSRLNMNSTDYDNEDSDFAVPYAGFNKRVNVTPIVMNGAGGVTTTAQDLGVFEIGLINYYNNGNHDMFTAQDNTESAGGKYALGIIPRKLADGRVIYEHNGTLTGWNAQIAIEPSTKSGIVIMTNSDKAFYLTYELMEKWSEHEFGEKAVDTQIHVICDAVYKAVIILSSLLAAWLSVFVYRVKKGKLIRAGREICHRRIMIRTMIILILTASYYTILYTNIPFSTLFNMKNYYLFTFFPPCYIWINILLAAFSLFIIFKSCYISMKSRYVKIDNSEKCD